MSEARKRYLFFDVDGTLIAGGSYAKNYIPESTRRAIELLRADGHFLCLATGRSEAMARGYMQELGFDNMVSDGGYGITIEGKLLGIKPLPKDKMIALLKECESRGIPWAIQPDNSVTRLAPDGRFYDFTHDTYQETRTVPGESVQGFHSLLLPCRTDAGVPQGAALVPFPPRIHIRGTIGQRCRDTPHPGAFRRKVRG